jgi:hypothetical protein
VSDVFQHLRDRPLNRVAIVGLGTGALACYGTAEDSCTFYEIDPMVAAIAHDPRWGDQPVGRKGPAKSLLFGLMPRIEISHNLQHVRLTP